MATAPRVCWTAGPKALRPVSRRSSAQRSGNSSRAARTGLCTGSYAGVGSICSASSWSASGSPTTSARSASSSRRWASRTSVAVRVTRLRTGARSRRLKNFPATLRAHLTGIATRKPVEIWFQDEARIGQKNGLVRQWAKRGTRPRQPADQRYESAYLFGAICPARGTGSALALPFADTEAMQLHLDEIARTVTKGAHAVLLLDRAD